MPDSFLGIVCGLKSEADVVRKAMPGPRIRIAVSGANAERAEALAHQMCAEGARAIVSIGVSGGLAPGLSPGALLIGEEVVTAGGDVWASNLAILQAFEDDALSLGARRVTIFGADEIIASADDKKRLYETYGAAAVDMESHGAARAAGRAGVPFAAIRAIADPASRALPPAALNAVAPDGSTRTLAVLGACARDPGQFPQLLQLGADSGVALKTLRRSLARLLVHLLTLDLG